MDQFWDIRSENYDQLFWVKDESYLEMIRQKGGFKTSDLVLDVGSGTGAVARHLAQHVRHLICVDVSSAMLTKGKWDNMSVIKWDISDRLFADKLFDKIVARMVFHHITTGLDRAIVRCHDLLLEGGRLIVAEGIPPTDDDEVVNWYTEMFKLKEKRLTFRENDLPTILKDNGFRDIQTFVHMNHQFSIRNWLVNSGLEKELQDKIYQMHVDASPAVKEAYQMRIDKEDCLVQTKNLIVAAEKK